MQRTEQYIGKCIYCGSTDNLSDEHTIPLALRGVRILRKASCPACAGITSQTEQAFLRGPALGIRTVLSMKTRHPKNRPKDLPLEFIRDGKCSTEMVPIDDYVPALLLPEIGWPGVYRDFPHAKGLKSGDFQAALHRLDEGRGDDHCQMLLKKYNADEVAVPFDIKHDDFLRMIAKIAHCEAILFYGINNFEKFNLIDCILGKNNDVSNWVGSDGMYHIFEKEQVEKSFLNSPHIIAISCGDDTEVWVRIKLWNKSKTPEYTAIVGNLGKRYVAFLDFHRVA